MTIVNDIDALAAERLLGRRPHRRATGSSSKAYGCAPRPRDPERDRHAVRDRERREGSDRARRRGLVEDGTLELTTTARSLLGDDLPLIADDDRRAPARASLGDRGLLRRGCRDRESPTTCCRYPSTDSSTRRTTSRCSAGIRRSSRPTEALLVLQRRLRRARADRGASERRAVPRPRRTARLRAGRDVRDGVPALGRAAGRHRARLPRGGRLRTNVLHLPVRGSGDGGIYTTAADVRAFWEALLAGRIVARVAEMTRPRATRPTVAGTDSASGYTQDDGHVMLEGYDAGVSFRSLHDPWRA